MIGETVSHYRIVEKLGQGGMGVVYKAEDTRLRRPVALKFLQLEHTQDDQARKRFVQEAQSVSRLQHANICTIHEIDETASGQMFICMDFYTGETLRDVIGRGGAPAAKACPMIVQSAAGLATAHEHGVIHRDIKPANLLVLPDGSIKVMDFGIAKLVDTTQITQTGVTVGTAAYMSPEQARGEEADARSDVFSLGVVLYELLTGVHPFAAPHQLAIMYRIAHERPRPASEHRPEISHALDDVLDKATATDPAGRFPSMRAFSDALVAASTTNAGIGSPLPRVGETEIDSLAVLPFVNESDDVDAEYLSAGLTDALIDNLCQLPRLRVMARGTVFTVTKENVTDPRAIGAQLGVRAVLIGRLMHRGDKLLVRAELVDARDGTRLWGSRFQRPLSDLQDIEEEISREISNNLRMKLNPQERELLSRRRAVNPEAHRAYLKGRHVWNRWKTPDGMRMAIGFFERALEIDPLFALAFGGLADSHSMLGNVKAVPPAEAYLKAKTAAMQGLAIDDASAELHTSLGFVQRFWEWDWTAATASFQRAIELNPGYATAHRWYGQLLAGLGRFGEGIAAGTRAAELDPLSTIIMGALGDVYFYARRYKEAIALYQKSIELEPEFIAGHTDLARACELTGKYDEAIAEFETAAALAPKGPPEPSSGLAHVYAQMGERKKSTDILERLIAMRETRYVSAYGIASIYSCLRDVDTAFRWLETAYEEHDQTLVWVKVHPRLDPLRSDPRYATFLAKMGL